MILPAAPGRALGDKVQSGDSVHLANLYAYAPVGTESAGGLVNFGGFLDTRGQGCQGNLLCVATSSSRNRDSGSGTWKIELIDPFTNPTVITGLAFSLNNGYGNFSGGYLDTDNIGCNGNFLCVSTSSVRNRDSGSRSWRAVTPIPLSTATQASKQGDPQ